MTKEGGSLGQRVMSLLATKYCFFFQRNVCHIFGCDKRRGGPRRLMTKCDIRGGGQNVPFLSDILIERPSIRLIILTSWDMIYPSLKWKGRDNMKCFLHLPALGW